MPSALREHPPRTAAVAAGRHDEANAAPRFSAWVATGNTGLRFEQRRSGATGTLAKFDSLRGALLQRDRIRPGEHHD